MTAQPRAKISSDKEREAGFIKLQHYMRAEQIEAVLNLRGAVLKVTIEEE